MCYKDINLFVRMLSSNGTLVSGVARAFPGGRAAHPEDQNEEESNENLRKNEVNYRKMRKDWGMFLSCPTVSERLATALTLVIWQVEPFLKNHQNHFEKQNFWLKVTQATSSMSTIMTMDH